jgi:hypothetical protein
MSSAGPPIEAEVFMVNVPASLVAFDIPSVKPTKLVLVLVTVRFSVYSPAFIFITIRMSGSIFATA